VEGERDSARPVPGFEPPVDPGAGSSLRGLALVARIMRGRELAAGAAGIPPLESDQVLDLQRTAGNRLTSGALDRWNDLLADGPVDQNVPQELLGQLFAARAADAELHGAICAALDGLAPRIGVGVSGPAGPVEIALRGPAGGAATAHRVLAAGGTAGAELPLRTAFGPAAAIAPGQALSVTLTAPDGTPTTLELPVPFERPAGAAGYVVRAALC
jgi:hypothetical protein